jgi:archaellum component FlaC
MTPEQKDELLIRIDERLKSVDNKLVAHIMQSNEYRADTKKEIENINKEIKSLNKWRYGVLGSWIVGIGGYFKNSL